MEKEPNHPKLKTAIKAMRVAMTESVSLADAFAKQSIFPRYCSPVIRAGENAGILDALFKEIGLFIKLDGDVQEAIKSALLVPKIVLFFLSIAMALIFTLVIPKYQTIYHSMGIPLPALTRFVFGTYQICKTYWYLVITGIGAAIITGIGFLRKNPSINDKLKLKIPVYKGLYYKILQYRFCKGLSLLLESGIGAPEALKYTADVMNNVLARETLNAAARKVLEGIPLAETICESNHDEILEDMPINFITIGNETGDIPELLKEASEYYNTMINLEIKDFATMATTAILVPTAAFELLILLSILLPSYSMVLGVK